MRVVTLRSAVCLLGRFPALAGVDFDVDAGETVLVSGPNGAGKTTLLRVCAGLLPLRSGTATVLGHDLARDRRTVRRAIGLVGHETYCYDDLTTAENLRFAARAAGADAGRAADVLERVGLTRAAGILHGRLSNGQRRRLALAIALVRRPQLLLLDEPHAGLDASARAASDELLAEATAASCTVVLASHEVEHARTISSREVELVAGRVQAGPVPARPILKAAT